MALLPLLHSLPTCKNPSPLRRPACAHISCSMEVERGVEFETAGSFFRRESAVGRDLGVLSAALHRRALGGEMRIFDAMCGCGVRSLRYLRQAGASFVWANDANEDSRGVIVSNLSRAGGAAPPGRERRKWVVSHSDANRVMAENYLQRVLFDMVDVDSFGSDSSFLRSAILSVKLGGLLYVTSTDGYTSGGHRPQQSLASYGAYIRHMPYSNEVGLRMLIGGALREATALGFHLLPLFSYYSYHGPVFRVMLRVLRGKLHDPCDYGFISYCNRCGHSQGFSWEQLGQMCCPCCSGEVSRSLVVSGPVWTGALHDANYVGEMLELAGEFGWTDLEKLLKRMLEESDPRLPFGYIKVDEIARRAKINSPPLGALMSSLQKEGYVASRSHISLNALKTDCPMATCIEIARKLQWR
ncbi:unnamed protein product [Spirodela intermedia]|uniref:Uncharacterized protein n=2 Tax=Spirodela intermedia TaxID=51605 RepID=A0A7I8JGJ4_SPIIN|nr:unnamed protein product [Spirodela intermedia]CAA6669264.1 unnamed protein product [Spirodela intermedia]CAA7406213.1 unnamed protein product [Spirodela intermedia]